MGTTPIYQLPYPEATDPADVPVDMRELAERVELMLGFSVGASPPASPVTGQLWLLPLANGVNWLFRYNGASASPYKWEFIGGPDLSHYIVAGEGTNSGSYVDLTTVGPQVTVPRAGDYQAEFSMRLTNSIAASVNIAALRKGATAPDDRESIWVQFASASQLTSGHRANLCSGLAASDVLKLQYRGTGGQTYENRLLLVRPIRVS